MRPKRYKVKVLFSWGIETRYVYAQDSHTADLKARSELQQAFPTVCTVECKTLSVKALQPCEVQPMAYSDFYTVSEVAAMLHVKPQTVRSWIQKGLIEDIWDGRKYLISKDEFLYFKRNRGIMTGRK